MSLPADLQHICTLISKLCEDHDLQYMTLGTTRSGDGPPCFRKLKLNHELGEINVLMRPDNVEEQMLMVADIAVRTQQRVQEMVRTARGAQESHASEIERFQGLLTRSEEHEKRLKDLIPPPLIELAQCAAEPEEVTLDDIDLPF